MFENRNIIEVGISNQAKKIDYQNITELASNGEIWLY